MKVLDTQHSNIRVHSNSYKENAIQTTLQKPTCFRTFRRKAKHSKEPNTNNPSTADELATTQPSSRDWGLAAEGVNLKSLFWEIPESQKSEIVETTRAGNP